MEEFEVNMVKAAIITGNGINSDIELGKAFEMAGAQSTFFPITTLLEQPELLQDYHILGFPGGFSYGDHLGSGQVFGNLVKKPFALAWKTLSKPRSSSSASATASKFW
jgi:phosphoribosylformylglycinamidine (FGAM) synthase-like amidotransferase family enzyme